MDDASLQQLWVAVRQDFDRALTLLPSPRVEVEGSAIRLGEWLDHNELELALNELEDLGEDNAASPVYWQVLASAADRMGLGEHKARLIQRTT